MPGVPSLLLIVGGAATLWLLLLYFAQRPMMFPGTALPAAEFVQVAPPEAQQLWVDNGTGRSEVWWLPTTVNASQPAPVIIFYHGNYELIDDWPTAFAPFREIGFHVVLAEYPGYGRSGGQASRETISRASVALYDQLAGRADVDADRIVAWGRSLGGGAVADLSRERPLRALVLESSFASVRRIARRYLLPPGLIRDPFDVRAGLSCYEGPVLIIHGRHDTIIPPVHAEIMESAADKAELIWRDCGHNDCDPLAPAHVSRLRDFLERHVLVDSS